MVQRCRPLRLALTGISQGIVLRPGRLSSIVEVRRIKGPTFNSKEAAEHHAIQLCKDWIDKRVDPSQPRR